MGANNPKNKKWRVMENFIIIRMIDVLCQKNNQMQN